MFKIRPPCSKKDRFVDIDLKLLEEAIYRHQSQFQIRYSLP